MFDVQKNRRISHSHYRNHGQINFVGNLNDSPFLRFCFEFLSNDDDDAAAAAAEGIIFLLSCAQFLFCVYILLFMSTL